MGTKPAGVGTLPPVPPTDSPGATWVPKRPVNANYDCLEDFDLGCHSIKDRRTCLSSRDGRNTTDRNGLKIFGEPCTWCGGIACTTGSWHTCEPLDYLLNGQGKEFLDFTARRVYTVAKCKDGRPILPSRREPTLALADAGRHQSCGDEKVFTVPHIKDTWSTCANFCENKASVTYPYGKLGWICIRAWYADGNTYHAGAGGANHGNGDGNAGASADASDARPDGPPDCDAVGLQRQQYATVTWVMKDSSCTSAAMLVP